MLAHDLIGCQMDKHTVCKTKRVLLATIRLIIAGTRLQNRLHDIKEIRDSELKEPPVAQTQRLFFSSQSKKRGPKGGGIGRLS